MGTLGDKALVKAVHRRIAAQHPEAAVEAKRHRWRALRRLGLTAAFVVFFVLGMVCFGLVVWGTIQGLSLPVGEVTWLVIAFGLVTWLLHRSLGVIDKDIPRYVVFPKSGTDFLPRLMGPWLGIQVYLIVIPITMAIQFGLENDRLMTIR